MSIEQQAAETAGIIWIRFIELLFAPLRNQDMLWAAVPLAIATLFITLYFGRNRREELGWNTAFGNTMVFLFVAINLIKEMYKQGGSLDSLFSNTLYLSLCLGLATTSLLLMFITYFHLLPKKVAFFLFSAPPINVTVYVVMAVVYANVPPDYITVLAAFLFLFVILVIAKTIQAIIRLVGLADRSAGVEQLEVKRLADRVEEELRKRKRQVGG